MRKTAGYLCLVGLLAAFGFPLAAQKPSDKAAKTPPAKQAASKPAAKTEATPGMRVFKDPQTGQFREGDKSEIDALTGSGGGLPTGSATAGTPARPFALPKGGIAVPVDESSMAYSVAKIGPDGKLVTECVTGEKAAKKALTTPVSTKQRPQLEEQ